MALKNKLGITDPAELAREEERLSKKKAAELYDSGYLDKLTPGTYATLAEVHRFLFSDIYLLAMERSPIRDIEIKHLLKAALTDKINDREIYMKGIDHSYHYEGYSAYKTGEL